MLNFLEDTSDLVEQIKQTLYEYNLNNHMFSEDVVRQPNASAVLAECLGGFISGRI